jgi:hypothetical protein
VKKTDGPFFNDSSRSMDLPGKPYIAIRLTRVE